MLILLRDKRDHVLKNLTVTRLRVLAMVLLVLAAGTVVLRWHRVAT